MISIIIPTLNEEKYLPKLLASIEKQEFDGKYEVIVVDSQSTDRTIEIAENFGAKVILTEKKGAGYARNIGASRAKFNNLLFIDADVILPKNALSSSYRVFKGMPDVIAFTAKYIYDNPKFYRTSILSYRLNEFLLERAKLGVLPAFFLGIKKEIFNAVRGFPMKYSRDDLEFTFNLRRIRGRFYMLPDVTVIVSSRRFDEDGLFRSFVKYLTASYKLYRPVR